MVFKAVTATKKECEKRLPGDELINTPDMTIDSAFTLSRPPGEVFPWFVQLGKKRAGWYFTRRTEKLFFPSARGIWRIDPRFQQLKVGDRIPDYGKDGYFDCFYLKKDHAIGYTSTRGSITMTWVLAFEKNHAGTRVHIRLRASGFRHKSVVLMKVGYLFDRVTIAWLAAGLKQRIV